MSEDDGLSPGSDLVQEFLVTHLELVTFVEECREADWGATCTGEGWTVGVVAHHCAWGYEVSDGWLQVMRTGQEVPGTPAEHSRANEQMAAQQASISRAEVLAMARENAEAKVAVLRSLTPAELGREVAFGPAGGARMSVAALAGNQGHVRRHLASMRAAVAAARGDGDAPAPGPA